MILHIDYNAPQPKGDLVYYSDEFSLDTRNRKDCGFTSILVNDVQLEINEDGIVCAVWGMCPHIVWKESSVALPRYKPGALLALLLDGELCPGVSLRINSPESRWAIEHDSKTGWIALSSENETISVEAVEFLPNCIAALHEKRLVCLWLKPEIL